MKTNEITQSSLVEFINPTQDEIGLIFLVLEDRDTRVLVKEYNNFSFLAPTFVYLKSDLKIK